MATTAEREKRLPRWAQDELERLRRVNARLQERIEEIPVDQETVLWANPYSDHPRPLAKAGERVRFAAGPESRDYLDVRLDPRDGALEIMGDSTLIVRPQVTNVIHVLRQERDQ